MKILTLYNDIPENLSLGFQEEGSIIMRGIIDLHNHILYYLIIVLTIVIYFIIIRIKSTKSINWLKYFNHSTTIETIWTIIPAIILIIIAIPSFQLLYCLEPSYGSTVTLKIIGNQWFWSYEYGDIDGININFDSYTKTIDILLELGELRLLDVDNQVYLPINTPIRLLITSNDVIHSWFIPSLGIKTDAIPGRINYSTLYITRPGIFYGQCAELCGQLHSTMAIVINAVPKTNYINWLINQLI